MKRKKASSVKANGAEEAAAVILKSAIDPTSINDRNYSLFQSSLGFGTNE